MPACQKSPAPVAPASTSPYPAIEIRFSDPGNGGVASSVFAYAKREKSFEKPLAEVNATITWVPGAQAFSANFEAMNAGAINASGGAISPIVGALAHNLRFRIFAIGDPNAQLQQGIIVPKGSPIKSLEDLVGKRVAVNAAAHGEYMLLKALANKGISASRVERVPIQPPDAAAAFATGKIDAWSTFGVFFNTAVRGGARVLAYEKDLASDDVTVISASTEVLEKNPAAFRVLLRVAQSLVEEEHAHPERFVNVFTTQGPTALSGDELALALEAGRTAPLYRVPTAEDRQRVTNVTKLFFSNHAIDRDIDVKDVVFDLDAALEARHWAVLP